MTKRARREREERAKVQERIKEIEAAWAARVPRAQAEAFALAVAAARARGPEPRHPDMAPGTAPNPPRPGHEPRPAREPARPRGRR